MRRASRRGAGENGRVNVGLGILAALVVATILLVPAVPPGAHAAPRDRAPGSGARAASAANGESSVSIVRPAEGARLEGYGPGARLAYLVEIVVRHPNDKLRERSLTVSLRNNDTGGSRLLDMTLHSKTPISDEYGAGWSYDFEHVLNLDAEDLGHYTIDATLRIGRGQTVAVGVSFIIGIPQALVAAVLARPVPDLPFTESDVATIEDLQARTANASSLYVDPDNGKRYVAGEPADPANEENVLEKALGRPGWLPATAPEAARAAEIPRVLGLLGWRDFGVGYSHNLTKHADVPANAGDCEEQLARQEGQVYRKALASPPVLDATGQGAGVGIGWDGASGFGANIQRLYWTLAPSNVSGVSDPVYPITNARLLVTTGTLQSASGPPASLTAHVQARHADGIRLPTAADWNFKGTVQLPDTKPATDAEVLTVYKDFPLSLVLSRKGTVERPKFQSAIELQVMADPPTGWPPAKGDLFNCGWLRGVTTPSVRLIYHLDVNGDPCARPGSDDDGDGLPNGWECGPIEFADGRLDVHGLGADPRHKDIFVQCDWMNDATHHLQPTREAVEQAARAFADAPVANPDGESGITLHVDAGDRSVNMPFDRRAGSIHYVANINQNPFDGWFDAIKGTRMRGPRVRAFHYCIFIAQWDIPGHTGRARATPSNDFVVSLGPTGGTTVEQAGTFMHELGHTLGLHHGGDDDLTFKPNYLSLMNYTFQLTGLVHRGHPGFMDYSRFLPGPLNEHRLVEADGIRGPAALTQYGTTWTCPGGAEQTDNIVRDGVDWNCDGDTADVVLNQDINNDGRITTLTSYNDWPNLVYNGGGIGVGGAPPADTRPQATAGAPPPERR